jgi:hypothetical protein
MGYFSVAGDTWPQIYVKIDKSTSERLSCVRNMGCLHGTTRSRDEVRNRQLMLLSTLIPEMWISGGLIGLIGPNKR